MTTSNEQNTVFKTSDCAIATPLSGEGHESSRNSICYMNALTTYEAR